MKTIKPAKTVTKTYSTSFATTSLTVVVGQSITVSYAFRSDEAKTRVVKIGDLVITHTMAGNDVTQVITGITATQVEYSKNGEIFGMSLREFAKLNYHAPMASSNGDNYFADRIA